MKPTNVKVSEAQTETLGKCNFCHSTAHKPYDKVGDWAIVQCVRCGFCFTNPRPTLESLPSFYTEDYFKDNYETRFNFFHANGDMKTSQELGFENRITDIEENMPKRGKLLEIGSAMAHFLDAMKRRGWDVKGIEISEDAIELARQQGIEVFCGILEDYQTDEKFDVVCMYQVLEHVPDPAYVLERSHQLLNPGGFLVVEVPNLESFDAKINPQRRYWNYDLPRHLNHFSPGVLRKKLRKSGFEIVDIDLYYPNFIISLYSIFQRFKLSAQPTTEATPPGSAKTKESASAELAHFPPRARRLRNRKTRLLKRIVRHFPGWRFTIIARKIGE